MPDEDAERIERLIAVQEANTNALNRLVQEMQDDRRRKLAAKAPGRSRRTILEKPRKINVTPLVEAKLKQALARLGQ